MNYQDGHKDQEYTGKKKRVQNKKIRYITNETRND